MARGKHHKTGYVYRLMLDGVCVYVGQSVDLEHRIRWHYLAGKKFDSVKAESWPVDQLTQVESARIAELNPALNKVRPVDTSYPLSEAVFIDIYIDIDFALREVSHKAKKPAKAEATRIRLEPEQKAWVKAEMVRTNESEAVVIRGLIQQQINKEANNEKQNS